MFSDTLRTLQDDAVFGIEEAVRSIQRQDANERSGQAYTIAALCHRRLAICALLLDARPSRFGTHLCHSAQARLHFHQLVENGHPAEPQYLCVSKEFSFIDALAAGQNDLAAGIARRSAIRHNPEFEYEDDFLLHHFLQQLLLQTTGVQSAELPALLERWEAVLEGGADAYLDACRALLARQAQVFDDALQAIIDARLLRFQKMSRTSSPEEELRKTEGALFMNGLALVRLAELRGMETRREYTMIPALARIPTGQRAPSATAWMLARQESAD
ncbi:immunity 49 family protein [Myxococcus sp. AB036A]|uniref:immunity 49 family protein n=1 Tax=Myxococcus sp. AB036A TaxID=2562793 RepID=UPI0011463CFE|nr:immunity 49 family protein [Myxococcus sp. AB036A]